jgi:hypothetical protein
MWKFFGILSIGWILGCSSSTTVYETIDSADAGSADGAIMRGWGLSKDLVMGVSQPITVINPVFGDSSITKKVSDFPEAAQYTIQFGIFQDPNANATNGPPTCRATISWVTNGVQIQREVTIGNGTSISGSAEGVSIVLQDYSPEPNNDNLAGYTVTTTVVPGVRAVSTIPPTLVPLLSEAVFSPAASPAPTVGGVYDLEVNQQVRVSFPPNKGEISLYVTNGNYVTESGQPLLTGFFFDVNGGGVQDFAIPTNGFIPIPPTAQGVSISNEIEGFEIEGTATFTHGSVTVTGSGTLFTHDIKAGDFIRSLGGGATGYTVEVEDVNSDTSLTLISGYPGPTNTAPLEVVTSGYDTVDNISVLWGIDG